MTPEAQSHLDRAADCLTKARLDLGIAAQVSLKAEDAARNAYYAAFHAAKAFLFERMGKTHKTHGGVHKLFTQLAKVEPRVDPALRTFLARAYDFKRIADYDIGAAHTITPAKATAAVVEAEQFVAAIRVQLGS